MFASHISFGTLALAATMALACKPTEAARQSPAPAGGSATAAGDVTGSATGSAAASPTAGAPRDSVSDRADKGRILGSATAKVWIIEISDFQCPYCKMWHDQTYPAVLRDYVQTGKVRIAYLNFPLNIHPNAPAAAEAAMCASVQNRFWQMHDALFAAQEKWAPLPSPAAVFDSLAAGIGVDMAKWRSCVSSHATRPLIEADQDRSQRSGVKSTPSFFVGQQMIEGAAGYDEFRAAIEAALAKAGAATPGR